MTRKLLRDFIEHSLYARSGGYFANHVVGNLHAALPFAAMRDEAEYRDTVRRNFATGESGRAWLTPSEMFTPYYGASGARSIVDRHRHTYPGEPLQMLEVGGGNGTFARDVLDYLRN